VKCLRHLPPSNFLFLLVQHCRMVSLAATPPPVAAAVAALSSLTNSTAVPRMLDYIAVHHNCSTCQGRMHKADLSTVLGCPSRDLRLIDTPRLLRIGAFNDIRVVP
jgi:hypothetical protein